MRRDAWWGLGALGLVAMLGACAGGREVSKIRYTSTDCPDPSGCGAALGTPEYQLPDEAHDPVAVAATESEPPSCATVAVALTALELGNYAADDAERTDALAKHERACQAAKLDARELACTSTVTNVAQIGYCTRKLGAPAVKVPMLSADDCKATMAALGPRLQGYNQGANIPHFAASCTEDGWSEQLADCLVERGYYDPVAACRGEAPGWVFDRLQARIDGTHAVTR